MRDCLLLHKKSHSSLGRLFTCLSQSKIANAGLVVVNTMPSLGLCVVWEMVQLYVSLLGGEPQPPLYDLCGNLFIN